MIPTKPTDLFGSIGEGSSETFRFGVPRRRVFGIFVVFGWAEEGGEAGAWRFFRGSGVVIAVVAADEGILFAACSAHGFLDWIDFERFRKISMPFFSSSVDGLSTGRRFGG